MFFFAISTLAIPSALLVNHPLLCLPSIEPNQHLGPTTPKPGHQDECTSHSTSTPFCASLLILLYIFVLVYPKVYPVEGRRTRREMEDDPLPPRLRAHQSVGDEVGEDGISRSRPADAVEP
jgi:hypothetical protein